MKKVMGLLLAVSLMMTGLCSLAQKPFCVVNDITIAAGATTNYTEIAMDDLGTGVYFRELDEFIFKNASGTATGTVIVSAIDIGVTTQVYNAGSHIPGYSTISYPRRTEAVQSIAGWIVTNELASAVSTVVTDYKPYAVKRLLIKTTQPASATANTYKYSIKAK